MDRIAELKRRLLETVRMDERVILSGTVVSIQTDTCTVKVDDIELSDVKLKATANDAQTLLLIPTIGTNVMMISTDGSIDNLAVIKCDQIDKVIAKNGDFEMEIDLKASKIGAKNATTGIYELFDQLQSILKNLKVHTPVGPSGTPLPDSILAIVNFETAFKTILKQI